jgi:membrane-bound serine protease (ClpP class)
LHEPAVALADFSATETGLVHIRGETWQARTRVPVRQGQRLRVSRVDGLMLEVTPEE